jgi:hypothetical protein
MAEFSDLAGRGVKALAAIANVVIMENPEE